MRLRVPRPMAPTIVVVGAAFVIALGVMAFMGAFSAPERWEYSKIAGNLLGGRGGFYDYLGTRYYFYGGAVYPILLAAALWIGRHGEALALVLNAALLAGTGGLVYNLVRRAIGEPEARLAAALVILHPGALVYTTKLHAQTLDVFLIVLAFALVARAGTASGRARLLGTGMAAGLAVLSRGTILPFFALWGLRFLWLGRREARRVTSVALVMLAGGILVVAPVVGRGYLLYGTLVPLRTDTGVNLWYGNHLGASGTSYTLTQPPRPVIAEMPTTLTARLAGRNELEQNRVFTAEALAFARADVVGVAGLFARKLHYFWWFSPHAGLFYPKAWVAAYMVYYAVALLFAGVGLVVACRVASAETRRLTALFVLLAVATSLTQALFYVEGRHRWQIEPLLLVFTAVGLVAVWRWLRRAAALAVGVEWRQTQE